jgi:hypothetical protein
MISFLLISTWQAQRSNFLGQKRQENCEQRVASQLYVRLCQLVFVFVLLLLREENVWWFYKTEETEPSRFRFILFSFSWS